MSEKPKRVMHDGRKLRIWEREKGICWFCTKPVPMKGPEVTYDHRIPLEISHDDSDENIFPIHRDPCDKIKTAADQARIAKTRRMGGEKGQWARRKAKGTTLRSAGFKSGIKRKWPKRKFGD